VPDQPASQHPNTASIIEFPAGRDEIAELYEYQDAQERRAKKGPPKKKSRLAQIKDARERANEVRRIAVEH